MGLGEGAGRFGSFGQPKAAQEVNVEFPEKLQCLFKPSRYKVLYGGRGSGKSWGVARALLVMGKQSPIRVLCVREFQKSIADSVHQLLADQIKKMGLQGFYQVQNATILGANGTSFIFEGIAHNVSKIKSYEGIDVCWAEEAHKITSNSWNVLIPTIRKPGSEIWIAFNPELETDETYKRFVKNTPSSAIKIELNWRDNPWFKEPLISEKDDLRERDFDAYMNVWEGKCKTLTEGAVYANELRQAVLERRICSVPYDGASPVDVFFDLGWSDTMALWFRQKVGFEWHYIGYYENRQKSLDHYLGYVKAQPWILGSLWLPHDARATELGSGRSIEEQTRAKMGAVPVRVVKKLGVEDGINAARLIFKDCWFDEEGCQQGLAALRSYRYEVVDNGASLSKVPVHDWSSHGADGFRYSAVSVKQPRSVRLERAAARREASQPVLVFNPGELSWMGR